MKKIMLPKGQAVIIVLLIMVVALTVGISISLRSTKNIRISTRTEESQRAFSAAEAGLEAILSGGGPSVSGDLSSGGTQQIKYSATKTHYGDGLNFVVPADIARDDTQQVWLVSHVENTVEITDDCSGTDLFKRCYQNNTINVCWGNTVNVDVPALEATLVYKEGGIYKIRKYAYDPDQATRLNNFSVSSLNAGNCDAGVYYSQLSFPIINILSGDRYLALRLRLLYNTNKQKIAVRSTGSDLPYQGELFDSTGTVHITASETEVRSLEFKKSYPYLPGIFDFALYSGSDISK